MKILISVHLLLILLASTDLSLLSWIWGDSNWTWNYFQFSTKSGWGFEYVSDYSVLVMVFYIAGYAIGIFAYLKSTRPNDKYLVHIPLVLCIIGLLSFTIEFSHLIWEHHNSLIFSVPVAILAFGILELARLCKP